MMINSNSMKLKFYLLNTYFIKLSFDVDNDAALGGDVKMLFCKLMSAFA